MTELARLAKPRDLVSYWFAVRHGDFLTIHNRMAVSAICSDLLKAGFAKVCVCGAAFATYDAAQGLADYRVHPA